MEGLRLRLVFEDRQLLTKSQRIEGLKRSWILLSPQYETISDLSAYLLRVFDLDDACPDGLLLSMEGFVLPPFESTSILKENDVIRVKKKRGTSTDVIGVGDGRKALEVEKAVENQPVHAATLKLLANEEFEKESGGYQTESEAEEGEPEKLEENLLVDDSPKKTTVSKKRKASKKHKRSDMKKNRGTSTDIIRVGDGRKALEVEVVEKQPVHAGMKLLANEEFEKESGGYQSEAEEGEPDKLEENLHVDDSPEKKTVSKKRKASKKHQRSNDRRKRKKIATSEDVQNESSQQHSLIPEKSPVKNGVSSETHGEPDNSSTPEIDENSNNKKIYTPSEPSSPQPLENGKRSVASSELSGRVEKLPSRSTRRKKAKRKWLREQAKIRENELRPTQLIKTDNRQSSRKFMNTDNQQSAGKFINSDNRQSSGKFITDNQQSSGKDNCKFAEEHQQDKCNSGEDDIVPVVIGPGHIRFEPSEKDVTADADQAIQQYKITAVNFEWNGITSKRKGQKWGKEKTVFYKRSDQKKLNPESSDMLVNEEETTTVNVPVDFDKLKPCTTLPQIGDKVAYRLVELSASWTPELSSFRVGKVSKYDPKSDKITLVQVPEYPIVFEDKDEESVAQPNASHYGEDGSLEIDYSSLADVRIIKYGNGNMNAAKPITNGVCQASNVAKSVANGVCQASSSRPITNEQTETPTKENGKVDVWEELSAALSAKKAQLSQEDNWNKKSSAGSSSRSLWPYRAMRGSALGPTMARLRAQNDL